MDLFLDFEVIGFLLQQKLKMEPKQGPLEKGDEPIFLKPFSGFFRFQPVSMLKQVGSLRMDFVCVFYPTKGMGKPSYPAINSLDQLVHLCGNAVPILLLELVGVSKIPRVTKNFRYLKWRY